MLNLFIFFFKNSVGVGRYDIEKIDDYVKSRKLGLDSVFLSKSNRMNNESIERVQRFFLKLYF